MKIDNHITDMLNGCNKLLDLIKRTFKSLDKESFFTLYKSLVRSIIDYGGNVLYMTKTFWIADMTLETNVKVRIILYYAVFNVSTDIYHGNAHRLKPF